MLSEFIGEGKACLDFFSCALLVHEVNKLSQKVK